MKNTKLRNVGLIALYIGLLVISTGIFFASIAALYEPFPGPYEHATAVIPFHFTVYPTLLTIGFASTFAGTVVLLVTRRYQTFSSATK